jgi:outer membrane protein TolC
LHFFKAPLEDVSAIDLDKSIDTAVKARPELRQDLVNIQAASKSIKLARASLEPSLALSADAINYANATMATPRQKMAQIGLTLNIPIYDSGLAHEKVREAKDSEASAKDVYDAHITDVGRQVREAYLNIQSAAKQIEAADVALEHAAAARQLAQTRYEGGVGLYIDVTDAQQALASAETNQVNSVYNYLIAKAQFQHAVGVSEAAVETKASAKSSR